MTHADPSHYYRPYFPMAQDEVVVTRPHGRLFPYIGQSYRTVGTNPSVAYSIL